MAGMQVPVVMFPRFTSLSGATTFVTVGMDVSDYEEAVLEFYRSSGAGLGTIAITYEESTDQNTWTTCAGGAFADPGANLSTQHKPVLSKRWYRASVTLTGANPVVTIWAVGFLVMRES